MAEMALEMLDATERCSRDVGHSLVIRVGIDTGPVVVGVIGRRKASCDLWGDTCGEHRPDGILSAVHRMWERL
jgi:adenylate cyclase